MQRKLYALAALASFPGLALAEVPASVNTAITTASTDAATVLAAMIGVAVAIWGLRKIIGLFGR